MPDPQRISPFLPRTIDEALETLLEKMDLKARTKLGRMTEKDLIYLHPDLGAYIRDRFELSLGNVALMNSCRKTAGKDLDADSASFLIIRKLWEKLKLTYSLRVVE
ncbi:MAG: hypothetical protein CVU57_20380 [Deltaproteobacteria bacterium HGW-Deltaproteobacteria-15]|jgi:hypothetical protein|nr:MAG: hypothetical protein CVU57_20380 [Deltaproteobacteria bacterium HGW-Deltaproteobacteria-15]